MQPVADLLRAPPPAPAPAAPADLLDEASLYFDVEDGTLAAAVVIGNHPAEAMGELFARHPRARVLLIAPGADTLAGVTAAPDRCFVAALPASNSPRPHLEIVAEVIEFLSAVEVAPSATLVLPDPLADAALVAAVEDFCVGFSAQLLHAGLADADPLPAPILTAIAEFLFARRELYHALKYHWVLYTGEPTAQTGWRILECLADLGASEWVAAWLHQPCFSAEFRAQIGAELGDAPTTSARLRAECLAKNLAVLTDAPAIAAALAERGAGEADLVYLPITPYRVGFDGTHLSVDRDDYPLLVTRTGRCLVELNPPPRLADFRAMSARLTSRDQPHALVVGWVAHAWAAELLLSTRVVSGLPGWRRLTFLLERDAGALAALLGVVDLSRPLAAGGTRIVLGDDPEAALLATLGADADTPVPGVRVGVGDALAAKLDQLPAKRLATATANKAALDAALTEAGLPEVLAAYQGARPLRVAVVTTLYSDVVQHTASELAAAFRTLGHEARLLRETAPGQITHIATLTAQLRDLRPDLVVLINHTRAEMPFHPRHVPYACWIQDELPPLKNPAHIAGLGPLDFAFAFSPPVVRLFAELGHPQVALLPFAASAAALDAPIPAEVQDLVVFPTHLSVPRDPDAAPGLLAALEARFRAGFDAQGGVPVAMSFVGPEVDAALASLGLTLSDGDRQEARFAGMMLARARERIAIADKLRDAGVPFVVYGKGWGELPRFVPHHRGEVTPGEPLRAVLRDCKVVLHVNRGCNVHPRLLEGFASGGFVLAKHEASDDAPGDTSDQFALGRELCLFQDDAEMLALIARARGDAAWRRGVIEAARARIRKSHTYESRAETVIATVRAGLAGHLARHGAR